MGNVSVYFSFFHLKINPFVKGAILGRLSKCFSQKGKTGHCFLFVANVCKILCSQALILQRVNKGIS